MIRAMRVVLLMMILAAGPAAAQNMVFNPDFAVDLADWSVFTGFGVQGQWVAEDSNGDPLSGSGEGFLPFDSTFRIPSPLSQVVRGIEGSRIYRFGADIHIPGPQHTANRAQLFVNTYAHANCAGNAIPNTVHTTEFVNEQDVWRPVSAEFFSHPTARCLRLNFRINAPFAGEEMTAYVDNVVLEEISRPQLLFDSGFE